MNDTGTFAHFTSHNNPTLALSKLLKLSANLGDERPAAEMFLRWCLQLVPEERATARELADDPWLADIN